LLIAAGAFLVVMLALVFGLPPVIKAQVEARLSELLGRTVTLGRVKLDPVRLAVTLENFEIREKNAGASFLSWARLYVNFDALSSFGGDWVLSEVELDGFRAAATINADGSYNVSDLIAKFSVPGAKAEAAPRPVRVGSLQVRTARVDFSDRSRPVAFATAVGPISFKLANFRTAGDSAAPYHFEATTDEGEKFTWSGTLAAEPVASRGEFSVEGFLLKKYAPYLADKLRADIAKGTLGVRGRYEVNLDPKKRVLKLAEGEVRLRDFQLNERPDGKVVIALGSLDVTGVQADGLTMKASVARVSLAGGEISVRREKDGTLNLGKLVVDSGAPPAELVPPPEVHVDDFLVKDLKVVVADLAAPRATQLGLSGIQFSLKNVSFAPNVAMPLALSLEWAPGGTMKVAGSVTLKPTLTADLKTEIVGFELLPLSPYLEQFANARLTQGIFSTTNTIKLSLANDQPDATLSGEIKVERFGVVDRARNEELVGFEEFSLSGLTVATAPRLAVSVAEVGLVKPYARVIANADKSLNLSGVAKVKPSPGSAAPAGPAEAAPKIEVGRVTITDGDFSFSDRSIEPHLRMGLGKFGGTIAGLSSESMARADVDLRGVVDGAGPVSIIGKLDPLGASKLVDLKVDFKNVDLVPLSPYVGKFAGYQLARGKLTVDTKVLLEGSKIDATNVVTLNQFNFGAATNSPAATALPVRLGVALLKDMDGKIVIDLPVQGNLDDPNFRIGKVVMRVVVNLLTKAAVSPFALVGSMFGGGGDELAFQEFAPGSSELLPTELPKLETMGKALTNRPALSVGLEGSHDRAADTFALKRHKLDDRVRRQIWEERRAAEPGIPSPEKLVISAEAQVAKVKKLFDAAFPPGTQFGTPLPPAPVVAAPPPAPRVGWFKRIVTSVTGEERRRQRAAEAERAQRVSDFEKNVAAAAAAGLPLEEMLGRLAEATEVTENDLRALSTARAQRVRDYLVTTGRIAPERLFLAQGGESVTAPDKGNKGPRVFLSLQ
jgi:hypothetical protein